MLLKNTAVPFTSEKTKDMDTEHWSMSLILRGTPEGWLFIALSDKIPCHIF